MTIKGEYLFSMPKFVDKPYGWIQHIPFAFFCIHSLKPDTFLELGTHSGNSYFSFCQAVEDLKLNANCYAVDHWEGDKHSGNYGEEVYGRVKKINDRHFHKISSLLRMDFDDALSYFNDKSIDLLHIDGLHEYEAVKHDFVQWLPKMSSKGVVLFHDTNVREREFGVWKLFDELAREYKSTNFSHGHGLGVLCIGENIPSDFLSFVDFSNKDSFAKHFFATLGERVLAIQENTDKEKEIRQLTQQRNQEEQQLADKTKNLETLNRELSAHKEEIAGLHQRIENSHLKIKQQQEAIDSLNSETSEYRLSIQQNIEKQQSIESELQKMNIELANRNSKIISLNSSLEELQNQSAGYIEKNNELQSALAVNQELVNEHEQLIEKLKKEINEQKSENHRVCLAKDELIKKNEALQDRERSLLKRNVINEGRLAEIEKWNKHKDKAISNLEMKILLANEELLSKKIDLYEKSKTIEDIERKIRQNTEIIRQLQLSTKSQQEAIANYEKSTTKQNLEIAALRNLIIKQETAYKLSVDQKRSLEQLYKNMQKSFSWRITRPLRAARLCASNVSNNILIRITWFLFTFQGRKLKSELAVLRYEKTLRSSAFFDSAWYSKVYADVAISSDTDPVRHFLRRGAAEGRKPHPMFNTKWYLEQNPDVKVSNINPLIHFLLFGWKEGRNPSPDYKIPEAAISQSNGNISFNDIYFSFLKHRPYNKTKNIFTGANRKQEIDFSVLSGETACQRSLIKDSGLFDEKWYLEKYQDLKNKEDLDPIKHYLDYGFMEGRNPNPLFESSWYMSQYPEVSISGTDPLTDYILKGVRFKRNPNPLFNNDWYLRKYPDVKLSELNPLTHYLHYGSKEGRNVYAEEQKATLISAKTPSIAVICHLYYVDLWSELAYYIKNIPFRFDLFVSLSGDHIENKKALVLDDFPFARIKTLENVGRDVYPFHIFIKEIHDEGYELFCKIHSKRGHTDYGDLWRKIMLESLLGSKNLITKVVNAFNTESKLGAVGPESLYKSAEALIYGNEKHLKKIWSSLFPGGKLPKDWGFFAGTMFWGRTEAFSPLIDVVNKNLSFEPENSIADGQLAHALERIYGAIVTGTNFKTGLVKNELNIMNERSVAISKNDQKICRKTPTKTLSYMHNMALFARTAENTHVKCAEKKTHPLLSPDWYLTYHKIRPENGVDALFYHLLIGHSKGYSPHPAFFNVLIPSNKTIPEILKPNIYTSPILCRVPPMHYLEGFIDQPVDDRGHYDFTDFIKDSTLNPTIICDLSEQSLRLISMMDNYKKHLHKKYIDYPQNELISIVLPTKNREKTILDAIASVIVQTYEYWELLIINDGGSNKLDSVLKNITDSRIRYIKSKTSLGISAARNKGLQHASGTVITYLDDDDLWDPDFLLVSYHQMREKKQSFIYSAQILWERFDPIWKIGLDFNYVLFTPFNRSLLENKNYIDMVSCMHDASLIKESGGFDEKLKKYVDWDFFLKLSEIEHPASIPCVLSHYFRNREKTNATTSVNDKKNLFAVRNNLINRAGGFLPGIHPKDNTQLECFGISKMTIKARKQKTETVKKENTTIIIPNYESLFELELCLKSIESYTASPYEIVIADNNSSAETQEKLTKLSNTYKNVSWINASSGEGFTYAVNEGLATCIEKGDDIIILNNDTIVTPYWLCELKYVLRKYPEAGMVVPRQVLFSGNATHKTHAPNTYLDFEIDVNLSSHHKNIIDPYFNISDGLIELNYAPLFCGLISFDTIVKINQLDSSNGPHYRSDRVLCNTIRYYINQKIIYTPHSKLYHLQGVASKAKNNKS